MALKNSVIGDGRSTAYICRRKERENCDLRVYKYEDAREKCRVMLLWKDNERRRGVCGGIDIFSGIVRCRHLKLICILIGDREREKERPPRVGLCMRTRHELYIGVRFIFGLPNRL